MAKAEKENERESVTYGGKLKVLSVGSSHQRAKGCVLLLRLALPSKENNDGFPFQTSLCEPSAHANRPIPIEYLQVWQMCLDWTIAATVCCGCNGYTLSSGDLGHCMRGLAAATRCRGTPSVSPNNISAP